MRSIHRIEVCEPSKMLIEAMSNGFPSLEELVMRRVCIGNVEATKTMIRLRKLHSSAEDFTNLRSFGIGLQPQGHDPQSELVGREIDAGIVEDFILYLQHFAQRDMPKLQSFRLIGYVANEYFMAFVKRLRAKRHGGTSFFARTTKVEFCSMDGRMTVIPPLTAAPALQETSICMQYLLSCVRNNRKQECIARMKYAETMYIRKYMFAKKYAASAEMNQADFEDVLGNGGEKLTTLKMSFPVNDNSGKLLRPCNIMKAAAGVLNIVPTITTLDISSEIIEWTNRKTPKFMEFLAASRNVKVLHLRKPRSLVGRAGPATYQNNARLVRRLPAFLELIDACCPNLEQIYMEADVEDKLHMEDGGNLPKHLKLAVGAIERFEKEHPMVDVTTVGAQIDAWIETTQVGASGTTGRDSCSGS